MVSAAMVCVALADELNPSEVVDQPEEIDLRESSDEAIGDRIMEEMNGMKVGATIQKFKDFLNNSF